MNGDGEAIFKLKMFHINALDSQVSPDQTRPGQTRTQRMKRYNDGVRIGTAESRATLFSSFSSSPSFSFCHCRWS